MPRIKRWFPVSHDINRDPDIRVMLRQCGERSLRVWLEILSIADRNDGLVPGASEGLVTALSGASEASPRTVRAMLDYGLTHLWLVSDPCLRVAKYAIYHKTRETNQIPRGTTTASLPSEPSEPSEPSFPKKGMEPEVSVKEFVESWNEVFADRLPCVELPLSKSRTLKLKLRLQEHPKLIFWEQVFANIGQSPLLLGQNNGAKHPNWKCTLDFLIANDTNCLKIAEGNYV
mgnify:CR=1 FL=1